jgi:hypothetical protein
MGTGNLVDIMVFVRNRGEQVWKKLRDGKDCWTGHCHFHHPQTLQCSKYRLSHFVCPHLMRHSWGLSMIIGFLFASLIYVTRFNHYHSHIQPLDSGAQIYCLEGVHIRLTDGAWWNLCVYIFMEREHPTPIEIGFWRLIEVYVPLRVFPSRTQFPRQHIRLTNNLGLGLYSSDVLLIRHAYLTIFSLIYSVSWSEFSTHGLITWSNFDHSILIQAFGPLWTLAKHLVSVI